jgi:hypothetical protein
LYFSLAINFFIYWPEAGALQRQVWDDVLRIVARGRRSTHNRCCACSIPRQGQNYGGYGIMMTPVPPSSFSGAASVATIMASFAEQAGMGFENNGVTAVLSNPYFPGTLGSQIKACARHANINFMIDPTKGANGTLAIWPKNGYRGGAAVPVSAKTGMVGYPRYTQYGIDVDMLFNPNLVFGGLVDVTSELQAACGTKAIYTMVHEIECLTPNGEWLTSVSCFDPALFGLATGGSA